MKESHTGFAGTYFNKDTVIKIARLARLAAWGVLGVYGARLLIDIAFTLTQIAQGGWVGMRLIDIIQNILSVIEQVLPGVVYFFILMGIRYLLLIQLDVEDNTRRAARKESL